MRSDAETVDAYLAELPDARRQAIEKVRRVILEHLPEGMVEAMNWGMIAYEIPLERYPRTYNGKPLMVAALASQKNHMAVYLSAIYASPQTAAAFETAYRATGKKYDAGKSCVRFKDLEQLPLDLIGEVIAGTSIEEFIQITEDAVSARKQNK